MEGAPSLKMKLLKLLRSFFKFHPSSASKQTLVEQFELQGIAQPGPDTVIMEQALEKVKPYFNDEAFGSIARAYVYPSGPGPRAMPMAVSLLLRPGFAYPVVERPPNSTSELLSRMSAVFSPDFISHLDRKFRWFDEMCGAPVCDALLQAMSTETWTTLLVENTLTSIMLPARMATRRSNTTDIPQFDGPAPPPVSPAPQLPISQITLSGQNVKQAWATNDAIRRITEHEKYIGPGWSPMSSASLPVFHGTLRGAAALDLRDMETALSTIPTTLERGESISQLLPHRKPGIYTSFSALRSYIWTAFGAEVISDPPGPTTLGGMGKHIPMRGEQFRGGLVLVFYASQPAPPGLTSYAVPVGREAEWADKVKQDSNWAGDLKSIHGLDTVHFPDVLHGKDIPVLRHALQPFPCNNQLLWQTAWTSQEAADALNCGADEAFAISFQLEPPEHAEPPKGGKSAQLPSEDPKPKKKDLRAFRRKVGHGIKDVFTGNKAV